MLITQPLRPNTPRPSRVDFPKRQHTLPVKFEPQAAKKNDAKADAVGELKYCRPSGYEPV